MQPKCPVCPKLNFHWYNPVTTPKRGTVWRTSVLCRDFGNLCHQSRAGCKGLRLTRSPCPQPALERPRCIICIRLVCLHRRDAAPHTQLSTQRFPVHYKCSGPGIANLLRFGASMISIEYKCVIFDLFQQHHANIRQSGTVNRRQRDGIGVIRFFRLSFLKPAAGDLKRIVTSKNPGSVGHGSIPCPSLRAEVRTIATGTPAPIRMVAIKGIRRLHSSPQG